MENPELNAYAVATRDGVVKPNTNLWQPNALWCHECGGICIPRYRSHCRVCGYMVCSGCIVEHDEPPQYTEQCRDAPVDGPCKLCTGCSTKCRAADAFCDAMRPLLVLMAFGGHRNTWHHLAQKCPVTSPLGLAARFLLCREAFLSDAQLARVAGEGNCPSGLDRDIAEAGDDTIRYCDLFMHTPKLQANIAAAINPILFETPAPAALTLLSLPIAADRNHKPTVAEITSFRIQQFDGRHQHLWGCVYPILSTKVQCLVREKNLLTKTDLRTICLHAPPGDPSSASLRAAKQNKARDHLVSILATVVRNTTELSTQQQNLRRFIDGPHAFPAFGFKCKIASGCVRPAAGDDEGDVPSLELTMADPDNLNASNPTANHRCNTLAFHFQSNTFDFLRAAAFLSSIDGIHQLFQTQVLVKDDWECVMGSTADPRSTFDPFESDQTLTNYVNQCIVLTLMQACTGRAVWRPSVKMIMTRDEDAIAVFGAMLEDEEDGAGVDGEVAAHSRADRNERAVRASFQHKFSPKQRFMVKQVMSKYYLHTQETLYWTMKLLLARTPFADTAALPHTVDDFCQSIFLL
jgi:hypothetical protein